MGGGQLYHRCRSHLARCNPNLCGWNVLRSDPYGVKRGYRRRPTHSLLGHRPFRLWILLRLLLHSFPLYSSYVLARNPRCKWCSCHANHGQFDLAVVQQNPEHYSHGPRGDDRVYGDLLPLLDYSTSSFADSADKAPLAVYC